MTTNDPGTLDEAGIAAFARELDGYATAVIWSQPFRDCCAYTAEVMRDCLAGKVTPATAETAAQAWRRAGLAEGARGQAFIDYCATVDDGPDSEWLEWFDDLLGLASQEHGDRLFDELLERMGVVTC